MSTCRDTIHVPSSITLRSCCGLFHCACVLEIRLPCGTDSAASKPTLKPCTTSMGTSLDGPFLMARFSGFSLLCTDGFVALGCGVDCSSDSLSLSLSVSLSVPLPLSLPLFLTFFFSSNA